MNEAAFPPACLGPADRGPRADAGQARWTSRRRRGKRAAISYGNLSELELTLGQVAGAVGDAERSVTYADRSGDEFMRMANRTTHADALHQAGRRAEAEMLFRETEQMQADRQPDYPLLYSLQGFQLLRPAIDEGGASRVEKLPFAPRKCVPAQNERHQGLP